jgi:hypothetical protein
MSSSSNGDSLWHIAFSEVTADRVRRLQRRASRQGRGEAFTEAMRRLVARLKRDPEELGDPYFRLPALRLTVRGVVIQPVGMHFAVSDDSRQVYIMDVRLL